LLKQFDGPAKFGQVVIGVGNGLIIAVGRRGVSVGGRGVGVTVGKILRQQTVDPDIPKRIVPLSAAQAVAGICL
jgi:hypothetical protein